MASPVMTMTEKIKLRDACSVFNAISMTSRTKWDPGSVLAFLQKRHDKDMTLNAVAAGALALEKREYIVFDGDDICIHKLLVAMSNRMHKHPVLSRTMDDTDLQLDFG